MLTSGFMSVFGIMGQEPTAALLSLQLRIHETAVKLSGLVSVFLSSERLPQRQVFMKICHCAVIREIRRRVPITSQDPLGGEQSLQAHWTAGMDASRANANFSSCKRESVFRVSNMMEKLLLTFIFKMLHYVPSPNRQPSAKRELAFQKTQALST